jgi:tRNA (guanine37-N1)-methyltransferase
VSTFKIEILTIFPELFTSFINCSLIKKAIDKDLLAISCVNIRDFAEPPHFKVDDEPFGGGAGMLLKPEPLTKAIRASKSKLPTAPVILLSAAGKIFNQSTASKLAQLSEVILICGRYEGVDQRVIDKEIDMEISMGDYVVMGGEIPAMLMIEAITRLKPQIIGNEDSLTCESFHENQHLLEAPQYTRPSDFEGTRVPADLLSGDHERIKRWRKTAAMERTQTNRPDLIKKHK